MYELRFRVVHTGAVEVGEHSRGFTSAFPDLWKVPVNENGSVSTPTPKILRPASAGFYECNRNASNENYNTISYMIQRDGGELEGCTCACNNVSSSCSWDRDLARWRRRRSILNDDVEKILAPGTQSLLATTWIYRSCPATSGHCSCISLFNYADAPLYRIFRE